MCGKILQKTICAGLLGGALLISTAVNAGVVTNRLPLLGYANQAIAVYRSPGNMKAGLVAAETALIQIIQVRPDGWAYGSYPIANGRRANGWFKMRDIQANIGYSNCNGIMQSQQTVYRTTSLGSGNGSVNPGESVLVIGEQGRLAQIIYKQKNSNNWRIGWVMADAVRKAQNASIVKKQTQTNTTNNNKTVTAGASVKSSTTPTSKNAVTNQTINQTAQNSQSNSNGQKTASKTNVNNVLNTSEQRTAQQQSKPSVTANSNVKNTIKQSQGLKIREVGNASANQRLGSSNSAAVAINGVVNRYGIALQQATAYTNAGLTAKQGTEYASEGDIVAILDARDNAFKITYPAKDRLKDRWVEKKYIGFYDGVNYQSWKGRMKWRSDAYHSPSLVVHPVNPEYASEGQIVTVMHEDSISYFVSYEVTDGTHKARWIDKNAVERVVEQTNPRHKPNPIVNNHTNPIVKPVKRDDNVTKTSTAVENAPYRSNLGDLNGDGIISLTDVSKINLHIIGVEKIDPLYLENADINGDGEITLTDLSVLRQVYMGNDNIEKYKRLPYKKMAQSFQPYNTVAKRRVKAYPDSSLTNWDKVSEVFKNDPITVVNQIGNAYQVTYPSKLSPTGKKTLWVGDDIFKEEVIPPTQEPIPEPVINTSAEISPSGLYYPLGKRTKFKPYNSDMPHDCGSDYGIGLGSAVYAPSDGKIYCYQVIGDYNGKVDTTVSYGNVIYWVGNNYGAIFAHLQSFEGFNLRFPSEQNAGSTHSVVSKRRYIFVGSRSVNGGNLIGRVGSIGNSDGAHLHFEFYVNPSYDLQESDYGVGLMPSMKNGKQNINTWFDQ